MKPSQLLIFLAILGTLSCKKGSSPQPDTSMPYFKSHCQVTGVLHVVTKTGEVTDPSIYERWKKDLNSVAGFSDSIILSTFLSDPYYYVDSVHFVGAGTALMPRDYAEQHAPSTFTVSRHGDSLLLNDDKAVSVELEADPWTNREYFMLAYHPAYYNKIPDPNMPGFYYYDKYLQYLFVQKGDSLLMPMMAMAFKENPQSVKITFAANNVPAVTGYSQLLSTDTFAYQEYQISYVR